MGMKRMMNFLFLSCKRSTELFEKKQEIGVNYIENIKLTLHASMCKACTSYQKQSKFINDSLSHMHSGAEGNKANKGSKSLQDRIIKNLDTK